MYWGGAEVSAAAKGRKSGMVAERRMVLVDSISDDRWAFVQCWTYRLQRDTVASKVCSCIH